MIVTQADSDELARLGGPAALGEILSEMIESEGLAAFLARARRTGVVPQG